MTPAWLTFEDEPALDLRSSAVLHGLSAFSTVRVKRGLPLLWERHLERLHDSCTLLDLPLPDEALHLEQIQRIPVPEALYRLTVTPEGAFGLYRPLEPLGVSRVSVWLSDLRTHPQLGGHKTGNYLPYLLAGREAQAQRCFEALLRSKDGSAIVDGSRSALLLEKDGRFVTPLGGLPSVTRAAFLERQPPDRSSAQLVTLEDLRSAQHVWLIGSGIGLLPVHELRWRTDEAYYPVRDFEGLEPEFLRP